MNEIALNDLVDKLESVILNILYLKPEDRLVIPNYNHLNDIKSALNSIFAENTCTDVFYSNNTDNQFFGIKVNPMMTQNDALMILTGDEKFKFNKYQVEFDSKLFDLELSADEIVALLLYEISSSVDSYETIDKVRALIDYYVLSNDDVVSIRDSANYSQLIIYALKDTIYKVSSALFKDDPEELTTNRLIQASELEDTLISAQEKIMSSSYGLGETVRAPKVYILQWMFMIYKDMNHNSGIVKDTLKDARTFTSSKIDKAEIDKTLAAIDRINTQTFVDESARIDKLLEAKGFYSVCEISLFKSLKSSGLKGIENDLYEYMLRLKNLETEEDAIYILRGINTRLGIIEDYLNNTPDLSEAERKHWESVAMSYRELRVKLSQSKIWKKQKYGLFFDYNTSFDDEN